MDQVCLRTLTVEEIEEFRKKGKISTKLEFAIRCNKCKEKDRLITFDGYTIDTTPMEVISKEEMKELMIEKEINRYKASLFKKGKKQ